MNLTAKAVELLVCIGEVISVIGIAAIVDL
jgi:hypothetical protein